MWHVLRSGVPKFFRRRAKLDPARLCTRENNFVHYPDSVYNQVHNHRNRKGRILVNRWDFAVEKDENKKVFAAVSRSMR